MARVSLVIALLVLATGCGGGKLAAENADLKAKNEELTKKLVALEAENARLKQQIDLLTKTTDDLTKVIESQQAAGAKTK